MIKPKKQKTDRKELAELAEALLDLEMEKPASERDDALADEYAKTVLYARERIEAFSSVPASEKTLKYKAHAAPFKRFAVAAAALLLVFCVGASVAQASGLRVWSAIVHWDANYLKIDYAPSPAPAKRRPSTVIEYREFSSAEELKGFFGKKLLYPNDKRLEFAAAYAQVTDSKSAIVDIRLIRDEEEISVRGSLSLKAVPNDDISVSTLLIGEYTEVYRKAVCNADCLFAISDEGCVVSFAVDHNVYTIRSGNADSAEEIAAAMLCSFNY